MKALTYIRRSEDRFCEVAEKSFRELAAENNGYLDIMITVVDEADEPERAYGYEYDYLPAYFVGAKMLHEGPAIRSAVKKVLDYCIEDDT